MIVRKMTTRGINMQFIITDKGRKLICSKKENVCHSKKCDSKKVDFFDEWFRKPFCSKCVENGLPYPPSAGKEPQCIKIDTVQIE